MKKTVIITTVRDTFAFGITEDTFEQVYIPASLVKKFVLEPDDEIECAIIPSGS